MQVQIDGSDPQIVLIKQLLQKEECNEIINIAKGGLQKWTKYGSNGIPWKMIRVMKK